MSREIDPTQERILVRLPNWVGDVVMATPALRAIRRALPQARICAAGKAHLLPLLSGSEDVDEWLPIRAGEEKGLRGAMRLARRLREGRFTTAILLTNSLTSAIPPALAGIPRRVGFSGEGRRLLLTHQRAPERREGRRVPVPMPHYYQRVLDLLEIPSAGWEYHLPVRDEDREEADRILEAGGRDSSRPLLALNPGASFGASKLWKPERMMEAARRLRERHGWQPLVLCGPGEEGLAREIAGGLSEDVIDTSERVASLPGLRGLLERTDLLLSTDTGPRHVAVALKKPVVVLMGPTHPGWTACNLERTRVLRHEVPCGPCHLKLCPPEHGHRCMELIQVEEVVEAAEFLAGVGGSGRIRS